jgi:hypothetical protein
MIRDVVLSIFWNTGAGCFGFAVERLSKSREVGIAVWLGLILMGWPLLSALNLIIDKTK